MPPGALADAIRRRLPRARRPRRAALGNLPSRDPALAEGAWPEDPSRYIRDPWRSGALASRAPGPVLLVGTGLTMVDVALQLQAQTPGQQIIALSRGGLFPHAHRIGGAAPAQGIPVPDPTPSLLELLRFVRTAAVVAEVGGGDWRDAVNALRPVTSDLWKALPLEEQQRFVARLARFWDVHRHRLAPEVAAAVDALRESGRLTFATGRIRAVVDAGSAVEVTVQERGYGRPRTLRVASVVNCTGPTGNVRARSARACSRRSARRGRHDRTRSRWGSTRAPTAPCAMRGDARRRRSSRSGRCVAASCGSQTAVPEDTARRHTRLAQHLTGSSARSRPSRSRAPSGWPSRRSRRRRSRRRRAR